MPNPTTTQTADDHDGAHSAASARVKTRFAPSPTGYLHVGGARTALYAWLFAKRHGGSFVLRIEDTDRERSTQAAVEAILEGMAWLGLDCDQGPYYQTQHLARYQQVVQQLIDSGHAYRCYCSKQRLQQLREQQQAAKQLPQYDGCCRDLTPQQLAEHQHAPYVVRFKTPQHGSITFHDLVHGDITVANQQLDDLIIQRSDAVPTYHLAVVVDDWDTEITHVIRGDDHINNTPRQIHMLQALGAPLPKYAHLPMILGEDGKRLSKRHGAVSVLQFREQGYLPEALLNYLLRLGWSHGDQEIFSLVDMQRLFDLEHVSHAAAAFDTQKLCWLNQHYLRLRSAEELAVLLQAQFQSLGCDITAMQLDAASSAGPSLQAVVELQRERVKTIAEMAQRSLYFYQAPAAYGEDAQAQLSSASLPLLQAAASTLQGIDWNAGEIKAAIKQLLQQFSLKMPQLAQPLRAAISGGLNTPAIGATLCLLGQMAVTERIQQAIAWIQQQA